MRHPTKVLHEQRRIVHRALVREVFNSNECWPVTRCVACDAVSALAKKFDLDIDAIWKESLEQRGVR